MSDKPRKVKADALAKAISKSKEEANLRKQREKINRDVEMKKRNKALKILDQALVATVKSLEFFSRKERGPAEGTYEVQIDYSAKSEISAEENIGAVSNFTDENVSQIGDYDNRDQDDQDQICIISSDEEVISVSSGEEFITLTSDEDFVLQYSSDE